MRRALDIAATLAFFAAAAAIVVWLDTRNPVILSGQAIAIDGDSLKLNGERLRLSGIDAPELNQTCMSGGRTIPCGRKSRNHLRKLIGQTRTVCASNGVDTYDRWLVECRSGEVFLNREMVKRGWAVSYGAFGKEERAARQRAAGLWATDFQRPSQFRREQRAGSVVTLPLALKTFLKKRFPTYGAAKSENPES